MSSESEVEEHVNDVDHNEDGNTNGIRTTKQGKLIFSSLFGDL